MSLAFFTIATRGFLPRARVLADAVLRQHPQARFYVLIADRPQPEDAESTRGLECLYATELDLPYAEHFFFRYEAFELCTALKPYGLLWLLRHTDAAQLIYLDADIHVLAPFTPVQFIVTALNCAR